MTRTICYVTGGRADFGLMERTLDAVNKHPSLRLLVLVTGMHLSERFGNTIRDIEKAGFEIAARVPVDLSASASGANMARNIGHMMIGFVEELERMQPDLLLLLGDRGEMLAGAVAGIHLNIPVAHIHGGERSGTVDEPVRHAISKLAHLHFVSTRQACERLKRMGEREDCIWISGAPGLDGLTEAATGTRDELCRSINFDASSPVALCIHHPVLQQGDAMGHETRVIMESLLVRKFQVLVLMPNSDAGSESIRTTLAAYEEDPRVCIKDHLPRNQYVSWLAGCDLMIGNSSSGIIEAASFGTPVINVGDRQNLRERNRNVFDVPASEELILQAIDAALAKGRFPRDNIYGGGDAAGTIVSVLARHNLPNELLNKINEY